MMVRVLLGAAVVAVCGTMVFAQSNELASTMLMKEQAQAMYGVLNRMVKGEIPYDQTKVNEALDKLAAASTKIPQAFPASDKGKVSPNSRFSASPKVWDTRSDFEEYAKNLGQSIAENRGKIISLDALKKTYPIINENCNGCHNDYRLRKS